MQLQRLASGTCVSNAAARVHRVVHSKRCNAREVSTAAAMSASDKVMLGDSDLNVSVCCLGTMTWGQQNTEAEAHEQLNYSWEQGINFLDTAEMYPVPPTAETQGRTDKYIGTWLKSRGKRDDVVLATKVSGYSERNTWVRDPPQVTRVTRDQIVESVERSLQRLQTEHIDLLQVHWPDRYVPLFGAGPYDPALERDSIAFEEQLRGLEEVVKSGKVRYIGVSNETSWGVSELVHAAKASGLSKIVSIQNCYSLLVRVPYETDLAETCRRHNVGLLAYSPLAGGALSGKYISSNPEGARFNLFPGYMERYNKSLAKEAVAMYCEVAAQHGMTPSELALAWCRSRWFVASTIIGATSMPQLKENLGAFSREVPQEALDQITAIYKRYRDPAIV